MRQSGWFVPDLFDFDRHFNIPWFKLTIIINILNNHCWGGCGGGWFGVMRLIFYFFLCIVHLPCYWYLTSVLLIYYYINLIVFLSLFFLFWHNTQRLQWCRLVSHTNLSGGDPTCRPFCAYSWACIIIIITLLLTGYSLSLFVTICYVQFNKKTVAEKVRIQLNVGFCLLK